MKRVAGMSNLRPVTDLLDNGDGPVAFIQHRGTMGGLWYEPVCPWCGKTLLNSFPAATYGELTIKLLELQVPHMVECPERASSTLGVFVE